MDIRLRIREGCMILRKRYHRMFGDVKRWNANRLRKQHNRKKAFAKWKFVHAKHIQYVRELLTIYIIYGLFMNFMMYVIFDLPFTVLTPLAWGILAYLIKVEFPYIVRECKK